MHESPVEQTEWIERSRLGDSRAFAELIRQHERMSLSIAYSVSGCAATAADAVQDAMLRAWQRLAELDEPGKFKPWLARIVRNAAIDLLRRRPRKMADPDCLATVPGDAAPDRTEQDELRQTMNRALAELDEVTRTALTLRYFDHCSSREIGEALGLSPAAVDMRLSRGRAVLREKLGHLDPSVECTLSGGLS